MTKPITEQVRDRARQLLRKGWCRNVLAENARNEMVCPLDETAESWCVVGALDRASAELNMFMQIQYAVDDNDYYAITQQNDEAPNIHEAIAILESIPLSLIDKPAANAEEVTTP